MKRRVEPLRLSSRLGGVADGQRAVEHRDARVAALEVVDQVGIDPLGSIAGQLEERTIESRAHVEVFVVAHAGHERHAIEDAVGPQEEMVPVGPLVASIDQVAGEQDEIDVGMPAIGRLEQPAPALESRLGVSQVEEPGPARRIGSCLDGSPRPPPVGRPVAERVSVDRVRLQPVHDDAMATDHGIIEQVGDFDQRRLARHDPNRSLGRLGAAGRWLGF